MGEWPNNFIDLNTVNTMRILRIVLRAAKEYFIMLNKEVELLGEAVAEAKRR